MANVGFSLPANSSDSINTTSPPPTRIAFSASNSNINASGNNNGNNTNNNTAALSQQQLNFKNWFFQTASHNQPEASGASSPRQLRRILRRAWKALEHSPYYKTLRTEHASGSSLGDFNAYFLENGGSRSAPGSPPRRHRFKKNQAKSKSKSPLRRRGSESSENEQPISIMRPSTAGGSSSKVRPFSAGSVGSSTSSEGSESGNPTAGGDDPNRKLIPISKRIFPPSKVRPKSSGILRNAQPQTPESEAGKNVAFVATVDETQQGGAASVAASRRQSSLSASSGRRSLVSEDESGQIGVQMVIDTSNASAETAQLVTIQEGVIDSGSSKPSSAVSSKKSAGKGGAKAKQPFADLKIIDETAGAKGGKSTSAKGGKNKPSSASGLLKKTTSSSIASDSSSNSKLSSSGNINQLSSLLQNQQQQSSPSNNAGTGGGNQSGSTASGSAAGQSKQASSSNAASATAATLSAIIGGSSGGLQQAFSTQDSAGTAGPTEADDGSSSKGSKSTKDSGAKSSLLKKKDDKPAAASDSASNKDAASKDSASKTGSTKDSSKDSGPKDTKKPSDSKKEGSEQGGKKDAQTPTGAAPAEAAASATAEAGGADGDKAPLKREMSRISVKTNESRKSIDMSKHIMNLIHGGQAQEEQTKKPQTTNQSYIQQAIPALPMAAAVICLIINLFAPGVGTMISGLLVLCVGKPRIEAKENAIGLTIFVNFFVGISQLMTVTFFFVGWFWSMVWGINMIINSVEYGAEKKAEREKELQQTAMRAFGFIRADAAPAVDE